MSAAEISQRDKFSVVVKVQGKRFVLDPQLDATPIEAINLSRLMMLAMSGSLSAMYSINQEDWVTDFLDEYKLWRHFREIE